MRITLDLPDFTITPDDHNGYEEGTGAPLPFADCDFCGEERNGAMVKLVPFGWVHADGCLQTLVDHLTTKIGARAGWLAVAQHVAKYPSRHSASTIRAVIEQLVKWRAAS
jgi:hypothetical protein